MFGESRHSVCFFLRGSSQVSSVFMVTYCIIHSLCGHKLLYFILLTSYFNVPAAGSQASGTRPGNAGMCDSLVTRRVCDHCDVATRQ